MRRFSRTITLALLAPLSVVLFQGSTVNFFSTPYLDTDAPATATTESIESTQRSHPTETERITASEKTQLRSQNIINISSERAGLSHDEILINALQYAIAELERPVQSATAEIPEEEQPFFVIGKHVKLLPNDSQPNVQLPGTIQFTAQLENPHRDRAWRVQVEATVTNQDGSTRTAINSRAILLFPGQSIQMPVKFKAREPKYQPGLTLFTAFIKDMSGQIIDQATIAFNLENSGSN